MFKRHSQTHLRLAPLGEAPSPQAQDGRSIVLPRSDYLKIIGDNGDHRVALD
jgi:hypothetical protein